MTNDRQDFDSFRPKLIVTIDTEEEGLWSGEYKSKSTVDNIQSVPRFQDLCDRYSIRPTYLVTTPVAQEDSSIKILKRIQDEGRCEIGTHIHPWNSPPLGAESADSKDSFLCNLDPELQHVKLEQLTDLIEENFGVRPVSFRAGRYGIGTVALQSLRKLGYKVDSSVLPLADYRDQNGPDFRNANCQPYFPSERDIHARGEDRGLLEVPVTAGFTHRHFDLANRLRRMALKPPFRNLRAVGILDRTGIATKVKLSPEQASLEQMKKLARAVLSQGVPTLVLMFHSSSLLPGASPYVRTEADLDGFLHRLDVFFQFADKELSVEHLTLGASHNFRHKI